MKICPNIKWGLTAGLMGALLYSGAIVLATLRLSNSTAAIGFVFVPFYFVAALIVFFLIGYSLSFLVRWLSISPKTLHLKIILALIFGLVLPALLTISVAKNLLLTSAVFKIQKITTQQELVNVSEASFFRKNKFILGALAQHPEASPQLLDQIAKLIDPRLHKAMGSLFPLMGRNTKGLAVMRLVVKHPQTSPGTIEYLAKTSETDYVLGDIAGNSKTSLATLRQLETKKNYLIDWGLAHNPKTPTDVFAKLLKRKNDFTQRTTLEILLRNPSIPPEIRNEATQALKEY